MRWDKVASVGPARLRAARVVLSRHKRRRYRWCDRSHALSSVVIASPPTRRRSGRAAKLITSLFRAKIRRVTELAMERTRDVVFICRRRDSMNLNGLLSIGSAQPRAARLGR